MVKLLIACIAMLSVSPSFSMSHGDGGQPSVVLTMEQRRQRLQSYNAIFKTHTAILDADMIKVQILHGKVPATKENFSLGLQIEGLIQNAQKTSAAAQYRIRQTTNQTYIAEDDKKRMNITKVQRFDGSWREVVVTEDEKRAIIQQEANLVANFPRVEERLSTADKKVARMLRRVKQIIAVYEEPPLR